MGQIIEKNSRTLSRNVTIDFIRGIAVILVVLGHSIQYGSGQRYLESGEFFDAVLFKLIYSFHMPLFALLSGYLFYRSAKKGTVQVLGKRIRGLLIPVFSWTIVEQLYQAALHASKGEMHAAFNRLDGMLSKSFYFGMLGNYWFLWAMFWCSLAVLLVEKGMKGRPWGYLIVLAAALYAPAKADLHVFLYPCFAAGLLYHKLIAEKKPELSLDASKGWIVMGLSGALFILLLVFYNRDSYVYMTGVTLLGPNPPLWQLGIDIYRWCIGLCGSLCVILAVCKLNVNLCRDSAWVRCIAALGRESLGIYMINTVFGVDILPKIAAGWKPSILLWGAETAVFLAAAWIMLMGIRRVPVFDMLLLGGKYQKKHSESIDSAAV